MCVSLDLVEKLFYRSLDYETLRDTLTICCSITRGDRRAGVHHRGSAAVKGLPEGAETTVQGAEGAGEEAPEEALRAPPGVQQQAQEGGPTVQQEQVPPPWTAAVCAAVSCVFFFFCSMRTRTYAARVLQGLVLAERQRRAPPAAERRAAAAAAGSEAGAVLQPEVSTEGAHQDGKAPKGCGSASVF